MARLGNIAVPLAIILIAFALTIHYPVSPLHYTVIVNTSTGFTVNATLVIPAGIAEERYLHAAEECVARAAEEATNTGLPEDPYRALVEALEEECPYMMLVVKVEGVEIRPAQGPSVFPEGLGDDAPLFN